MDELRERLIDSAWEVVGPVRHMPEAISMAAVVDAVLAEIEQAGYRVVAVDRWERVAGDAERWRKFAVTGLTPDGFDFTTVRPGDLEGERG